MSRLVEAAEAMVAKNKAMKKQLADCISIDSVSLMFMDLDDRYSVRILVSVIEAGVPGKQLKGFVKALCQDGPYIVIFLVSWQPDGSVEVAAGCSYAQAELGFNCVKWVCEATKPMGGCGGGKAVLAAGGSRDGTNLEEAMKAASKFARENIRS
jgi:alanyl-tRNA synthetase